MQRLSNRKSPIEMAYPTPSQYQEAVQLPATAFADEELRAATPATNALGLPQPITGAFAAVFPMQARTRRYAAKCFLTEAPDQQRRYRAVGRHLARVDLPYTVGFAYQPEGIRVEGGAYPLLKMEWAEGRSINRFVEAHLDAPEVLEALAARWAELLTAFEAAGVAHGDLQHGNVLVTEGANDAPHLRLVDYDTMCVPALRGRSSPEVGHRNYQHPDRSETDFGPYLDRFAGRVIHLALRACVRKPALWTRYDVGENLLFRAADFYNPSASPLFEELVQLEALRAEARVLRTACYLEPEDVPALGTGTAAAPGTLKRLRRAAARRRGERKRAVPRRGFERALLPGAGLLLAGVALLAVGGQLLAGLGVLVAGGVVLIGAAFYRCQQLPLVRRRRRLRQEGAHFAQVVERLRREQTALEEQQRKVRRSIEARRAERLKELREQALYDHLKYHFIQEVGAIEGVSHKVVVRLKASDIRTAYEAAPERLASIRQLGEQSTARVAMWRAALVRRYANDLPDALSPAEEQRIARYVARRVEHLEEEQARIREKIEVQRHEGEGVRARREELPALSFGRYLRFLLHLGTWPKTEGPPVPFLLVSEKKPRVYDPPHNGRQQDEEARGRAV